MLRAVPLVEPSESPEVVKGELSACSVLDDLSDSARALVVCDLLEQDLLLHVSEWVLQLGIGRARFDDWWVSCEMKGEGDGKGGVEEEERLEGGRERGGRRRGCRIEERSRRRFFGRGRRVRRKRWERWVEGDSLGPRGGGGGES